jgi:hypothetical protein
VWVFLKKTSTKKPVTNEIYNLICYWHNHGVSPKMSRRLMRVSRNTEEINNDLKGK